MLRKLLLLFIILFLFSNAGFSQEIVPLSSWIYQSVDFLQAAGYFRGLDQGNRPWSRRDIASEMINIDYKEISNQSAKVELERLRYEFQSEIEALKNDTGDSDNLDLLRFYSGFSDKYSNTARNYIAFRFHAALQVARNLTLQYGAYLDQQFMDDPYFTGYEWRGFQGYQEQMFISWQTQNINLKFGRDYIKWGYGHTGNLFISDNSRPFDQISIKVMSRRISFQAFIVQLDKLYNANRYLNASRFEIRLPNNLFIGLGQSSLYGGEKQSIDFTMSNPLAFYSFTQDNDSKAMNMMLYSDLAWYFRDKFKYYGEFLIDDYQIDHAEKGDLEPNELAFLVGLQGVDLFWNLHGWLEFVQVRNRTYNVPDARPFEKFLHKNMPIAHPLGTDFQYFQIHMGRWMSSHFRIDFDYSLLRQGEGTIRGEFTEPWMADDVTMATGYSEKIPYGVVETSNTITAVIHYEYNTRIQTDFGFQYIIIDNYQHIKGDSKSEFAITFRLLIEYAKHFRFLLEPTPLSASREKNPL